MSLPSMADDLVRLLKTMFPVRAEAPAVVLVGHSMVRPLLSSLEAHSALAWLSHALISCCAESVTHRAERWSPKRVIGYSKK